MTVILAFLILAGAVVCVAAYGIIVYRNPLNPLTVYSVIHIAFLSLFSGISAYLFLPEETALRYCSSAAIRKTVLLEGINLTGIFLAFLTPRGFLVGSIPKLTPWRVSYHRHHFEPVLFIGLLLGALGVFAMLVWYTSGGSLWITDPRTAYQFHRDGAGVQWVLSQWFLMAALVYLLWAWRPSFVPLLAVLAVFCALAFFSGSKNAVLSVVLCGIACYHFLVRPIPLVVLVVLAPLFVLGVMVLQILLGLNEYIRDTLAYFEYFPNTVWFVSRINEFDYPTGTGILSSFWFYVPRSLYPDKPYEYGLTLIHEVMFPGMAEQSFTPGILGWSLPYLDFGMAGVFVFAFIEGLYRKVVFEYYLERRDQFLPFILMLALGVWPIWCYSPLPVVIIWSFFLASLVAGVTELSKSKAIRPRPRIPNMPAGPRRQIPPVIK